MVAIWLSAVRAAMRVAYEGVRARVSEREHRTTHVPAYTADEVIEAVARCWRDLGLDPAGAGPTRAEYLKWVSLLRSAPVAAKPGEPGACPECGGEIPTVSERSEATEARIKAVGVLAEEATRLIAKWPPRSPLTNGEVLKIAGMLPLAIPVALADEAFEETKPGDALR